MDSLIHGNQAGDIEAFNSTSRYRDDHLNTKLTILILKTWTIKFIHLNYSWIKPTPQIPKLPFWIYVFLLQMDLFLLGLLESAIM